MEQVLEVSPPTSPSDSKTCWVACFRFVVYVKCFVYSFRFAAKAKVAFSTLTLRLAMRLARVRARARQTTRK